MAGLGAACEMSCERSARRMAAAMRSVGIAAASGKRAWYLGVAAGTLLGALFRRRHRQSAAGQQSAPPAAPAVLPTPDRLAPLSEKERSGQRCAECGAGRGGLFYRINGRVHCQDCARAPAERSGAALLVPAGAHTFSPDDLNFIAPRETVIKRARVKAGPQTEVEGYTISIHGRDTGLSLTPEYTQTKDGAVTTNKARWYVTWSRVGQPVGGPFGSVAEARGLAAVLATIDWHRDIEEFEGGEIQETVRLARRYRRNITGSSLQSQSNS